MYKPYRTFSSEYSLEAEPWKTPDSWTFWHWCQELSGQKLRRWAQVSCDVTCEFSATARHFSRSLPLLTRSPQHGQTREVYRQRLSQMRRWSRLPGCGASVHLQGQRETTRGSLRAPQSRCPRTGKPSLPVSLHSGASLAAQWTRIHRPVQETPAPALLWKDPARLRAATPVHLSCRARVLESGSPCALDPLLCSQRSQGNEKPAHRN